MCVPSAKNPCLTGILCTLTILSPNQVGVKTHIEKQLQYQTNIQIPYGGRIRCSNQTRLPPLKSSLRLLGESERKNVSQMARDAVEVTYHKLHHNLKLSTIKVLLKHPFVGVWKRYNPDHNHNLKIEYI